MLGDDAWIPGVAFDGFDAAVEEVVRVVECVLVEGVAAADKADNTRVGPPAGAAGLLEELHPRSWVAVDEDGVEIPDVDADLEGVRTPDGADVARVQAGFEFFTPLVRESSLIGGYVVSEAGGAVTLETAGSDLSALFSGLSTPRKDDRLETTLNERGCEACSRSVSRSRLPLLAAWRLPEEPMRRAASARVRVDDVNVGWVDASQLDSVLARVVDSGRAGDNRRISVESLRKPAESSNNDADVAAKDAAVLLLFVDNYQVEGGEEPAPELWANGRME